MRHICHISTTFNRKSGSARRTTAVINECVRRGYRVSLIFGRDHDFKAADFPGVSFHCVPELVKYVTPLLDIAAPWKVTSLLKQLQPDIVHTHLAKGGVVGRIAAKMARVPWILHTVHGPTFPAGMNRGKRAVYSGLEKICGRFTDGFVFVGEALQESYVQAGICGHENSVVIRTGRPDDVIDRKLLPKTERIALRRELMHGAGDGFLLVVVGRIVPAKQLDHAVRILRDLRGKGVPARLAIVGKSLLAEEKNCEQGIRQVASDLGVDEFVCFTGFREDVLDIMDAADVVLLTSKYEGLPNVAVEALVAGTPMVAYDVSGVREVLRHGKTGFIVAPGDVESAVDYLLELQRGRHIAEGMIFEENRGKLNDFRERVMLQNKMDLYEQILLTMKA